MARERREARLCRSTRTFGYTAAPRRAPTARRDAPRYPADAIGLARNRCPATRRLETTPSLPTCVPSSAAILALSFFLSCYLFTFLLYIIRILRAACFCSFLCSFAFLVRSVVFFFLFFCLRYSSLQWYVALSFSATFFHHTSIRFIL